MTMRRYGMLLSAYLLVLIAYFIVIGLCVYPRGDTQFLTDDAIIRDLGLLLDLDLANNEPTTQIVVATRVNGVGCCCVGFILK